MTAFVKTTMNGINGSRVWQQGSGSYSRVFLQVGRPIGSSRGIVEIKSLYGRNMVLMITKRAGRRLHNVSSL